MIKRYNFCLIFIYLISLSARGQIKGVVTDESNNAPIEYATIILKKGGEILDGTISKPDGSFLFLVIPKSTFSIEVSFLGYQTKETEGFKIQKDNLFDLGTIGLQPSQNLLDEVVLQTNTAAMRNKIDRQVYSASEFSTARGGTGIDLIRNLPSVSINGMGEISVRGSSGFVVLLNNKPIQSDIQNLLS